jgi:TRAP-type uncharacterized transport system fused permease subunit
LEGYLVRRSGWAERVILFIAGLLMIAPDWRTSVGGLALGVLVGVYQVMRKPKTTGPVKPA